jgi:hypothetical protein
MRRRRLTQRSNILVLDSHPGSGKTTWAIQKMNRERNDRFIYITPYLTEVKRIQESCEGMNFVAPEPKFNGEIKSKMADFSRAIMEGRNIVSTHALFSALNDETIEMIYINGYTLILDEVMNVVEPFESLWDENLRVEGENTIYDSKEMQKKRKNRLRAMETVSQFLNMKVMTRNQDNLILWNQEVYEQWRDVGGEIDGNVVKIDFAKLDFYEPLMNMAKRKLLYLVDGVVLLWNFPIDVFRTAFKNIYILTFMFESQIQSSYFKFHDLKYRTYNVIDTGKYDEESDRKVYEIELKNNLEHERKWIRSIRERIEIVEKPEWNVVGSGRVSVAGVDTTLSKSWYMEEYSTNPSKRELLISSAEKFCRRVLNVSESVGVGFQDVIWSTFKTYARDMLNDTHILTGNNFLSIGTRATNDYSHAIAVVYLINKFSEPYLNKFFDVHNVELNQDSYALSELIQFIFRSNLRVVEPIKHYYRKTNKLKKPVKYRGRRAKEVKIQNQQYETMKKNDLGVEGVDWKWIYPQKVYLYIPSLRMRNLLKRYLWYEQAN